MSTVNANLVKLSSVIDPFAKGNIEITGANVGTVTGKFTPQQRLNFYNDARKTLFNVLREAYSLSELSRQISGVVVKKTDIQFNGGVATLPDGFIQPINLRDAAGKQIFVLTPTRGQIVNGTNPHFKESATNRFVVWEGNELKTESGSTHVPNANTYILRYYGLVDFSLSDVTGGTVKETFNPDYEPKLLEIAQALSLEDGGHEVATLVKSLVKAA